MKLFKFHYNNKIMIILVTSLVWTLNFRSTFKNNSDSMGLGSCWVLRFDPILILIKNVICILYFVAFIYQIISTKDKTLNEQVLITKKEGNQIKIELDELNKGGKTILNGIYKVNQLDKFYLKFFFWLKIFLLILFIYIIEELYFLLSNNHVLDRVICPIRNFGILLSLFIFSPLILNKSFKSNRHQIYPFLIIFFLSLLIILFNVFGVDRFLKKFNPVNSSIYYSIYFLIGLEIILIKYLVDHQFISIYLILGTKGLIGTIVFTGINTSFSKRQFFDFLDNILTFEYEDMLDEFEFIYKIIYIITIVILQWLKIYIINIYTENHLQMIMMMVDLIYFPFYCIERFSIQKFSIFRIDSFIYNACIGILNTIFMLIFNEILECKFWGLNKDLNKNINLRQNTELTLILKRIDTESSFEPENE